MEVKSKTSTRKVYVVVVDQIDISVDTMFHWLVRLMNKKRLCLPNDIVIRLFKNKKKKGENTVKYI